jgi:hypothetical protein
MLDWIGIAFAVLKAAKKKDLKVDPKYIVIKPRILSDQNLLRGVAGLRAALTLIPPAAMAAPALTLGEMGFKIWKRIALAKDYDQIQFPPIDPNRLRFSIEMDPELSKHYGYLTLEENWDQDALAELEIVYNDFQFITDFELLRAKYPDIEEQYIRNRAAVNLHFLQTRLSDMEQSILQVSHKAEIDHNIRNAFDALRQLFPAMNDWALFNSKGFDDVLEILDTIF